MAKRRVRLPPATHLLEAEQEQLGRMQEQYQARTGDFLFPEFGGSSPDCGDEQMKKYLKKWWDRNAIYDFFAMIYVESTYIYIYIYTHFVYILFSFFVLKIVWDDVSTFDRENKHTFLIRKRLSKSHATFNTRQWHYAVLRNSMRCIGPYIYIYIEMYVYIYDMYIIYKSDMSNVFNQLLSLHFDILPVPTFENSLHFTPCPVCSFVLKDLPRCPSTIFPGFLLAPKEAMQLKLNKMRVEHLELQTAHQELRDSFAIVKAEAEKKQKELTTQLSSLMKKRTTR